MFTPKEYANAPALLEERKAMIRHAVKGDEKPKRVPLLANTFSWPVVDSKYKLSEAIYDWDIAFEVTCQHHEKYEFDLYSCEGSRNDLRFSDAFAKEKCYFIDDATYGINYPDSASIADAEDYPTFIEKGLVKYYFENALTRKYGLTDVEDIIERFGVAIEAFKMRMEYTKRITKQLAEGYGVPIWSSIYPEFPCDTIFKAIRGMKGFSIDLRRNPGRIEETLPVVDAHFYPLLLKGLDNYDPDGPYVHAGRGTSLVHTVLNKKQFEKYQFPYLKRFAEELSRRGLTGTLFMEGSIDHIIDCFQDMPDHCLALQIETTAPELVKDKLPNLTLQGGFNSYTLGRGTKEECINEAKRLIDRCAGDGRFIFTADKMLSFPGDANPENMKAINDFLKEYAVY